MHRMREVLRLTRLAALLQLLADSTRIGWLSQQIASITQVLPLLIGVVPTVAVLVCAALAERRAWFSAQVVLALSAGLVLAFTVDSICSAYAVPRLPNSSNSPFSPVEMPLVCLYVPTVLGGWVAGRRGVLGWAALMILMLAVTITATFVLSGFQGPLPLVSFSVQSVVILILCFFVASLADRQREEHAQLRVAHQQLAAQADGREQLAGSRERLRLARDLHDTLAHTMAGLLVQLRAIDTLILANSQQAQIELTVAEHAAKQGLVDMRAAIGDLRATPTQDLGFVGALRHSLQQLEQRSGVQATLTQTGNEASLSEQDAETLYLIAQEALRNVERHAHASRIVVTVQHEPAYMLTIQDDGLGFDMHTVNGHHFGLRGMEERADMIGAHVNVESAPRQGTSVTITRA